jgi:hypothetical protein
LAELIDFLLALLGATSDFIERNQALIVLVGIPLLTMWVTQRSAEAAAIRASHAALVDRKLRSEMRIAEFRQVWINELRASGVEIARVCSGRPTAESRQELMGLVTRAELMMNPQDQDYPRLQEIFEKMRAGDNSDVSGNLRDVFQSILKREWDRLKDDLAKVEKTELP